MGTQLHLYTEGIPFGQKVHLFDKKISEIFFLNKDSDDVFYICVKVIKKNNTIENKNEKTIP